MNTYRIEITTNAIYEADLDALREEYPQEYATFMEGYSGPNPERAWIEDCLSAGGTELFHLVDQWRDIYVDEPKR